RQVPVRLTGIAIGEAEPEGESFAMVDSTAGIYFRGPAQLVSGLRPGDVIEIEGHSDPGEFAPFVRIASLRTIGHSNKPPPRPVVFEELAGGRLDAQWIEIGGIVRYCEPIQGNRYRLGLATGGGRLMVDVN